jgi:hypothetical protein
MIMLFFSVLCDTATIENDFFLEDMDRFFDRIMARLQEVAQ